jgi:uncharacterized ferredoxin-like protein
VKVGAKSSRTTTSYGKACKFDATADLEELQIEKSSESPNDRVRFRFDLQIDSGVATEHTLITFPTAKAM